MTAAATEERKVTQMITSNPLDMRGRSITTFIAHAVAERLDTLAEGGSVEVVADALPEIDNDLVAWCGTVGHELESLGGTEGTHRYLIKKGPARRSEHRLAMVISDPGLEELLSPLGFALAAALSGVTVALYVQGPAVRVLTTGFRERLSGPARPFSRFARAGLARAGHVPAQEKIRQLQALGARIVVCGPSMRHFRVAPRDLAFPDVTIAEYLTFVAAMAEADIHAFIQ